jgi:hypothetical protein
MLNNDNPNKKNVQLIVALLPIAAVCATAFFPLKPIYNQGLILVVLIWFQVSLSSGVFS